MSEELWSMVDWDIINRTNKLVSQEKRTWRSKYMSNIGPTGEVLYRRGHRDSQICPMCETIENNKHLMMCTSQLSMENFGNQMDELEEWLKLNTPEDIRKAFIENDVRLP